DVSNDQRKVIYEQRNDLLEADNVADVVANIRDDVLSALVQKHVPAGSVDEQWDLESLERELESDFGLRVDLKGMAQAEEDLTAERIAERILDLGTKVFEQKEEQIGSEMMRQ